jgi:RES domain-containing protein
VRFADLWLAPPDEASGATCALRFLTTSLAAASMFLWRISNHEGLDGRGGLLASARWHTQGRPIVYLAASPAGALVEVLVNLELDAARLPGSYTMLKAQAPDDLQVRRVEPASLPEDWVDDLAISRSRGDEWLASGKSALLEVPSAILPDTFNVLLNPHHADAGRITVVWRRAYPYDRRFFRVRK